MILFFHRGFSQPETKLPLEHDNDRKKREEEEKKKRLEQALKEEDERAKEKLRLAELEKTGGLLDDERKSKYHSSSADGFAFLLLINI